MLESTITSKGQTTLPKDVRETLGLKPGDKVRYFPTGDGAVRIRKVVSAAEMAGFLSQYYDGPPRSLEEMDEAIAEYLAEKHGLPYRKTPDAAE